MRSTSLSRGKIAAMAMFGAALVGGGGATAWAATAGSSATPAALQSTLASTTSGPTSTTSGPTTPPATSPALPGKAGKAARSLLARADHGTLEVRKGTAWITVDFDRGTVTAASATSVTLHRPDGQSVTLAITPATKFRGVTSASQLTTGRHAIAISQAGNALHITERAK